MIFIFIFYYYCKELGIEWWCNIIIVVVVVIVFFYGDLRGFWAWLSLQFRHG